MRATELSRAIVAPTVAVIHDAERERVRQRLVDGVARLVGRLPDGERLELTLPTLRRALAHPELLLGTGQPFTWQPKFVRRSLGLAVVRACVEGRFRSPVEAIEPVAAEAVDEWTRTGWKTYFWEPWLAGLVPAAQAMVLADAVGWATAMWTSLDWRVFEDGARLGGPDDQWALPVPRPVRLKSRCELRLATRPAGAAAVPARPSLVSVAGGMPSPTSSDELVFLALAALRAGSLPLPARITGLWPDAGLHRVVELDLPALERGVDRTLEVVEVLVEARVPGVARP